MDRRGKSKKKFRKPEKKLKWGVTPPTPMRYNYVMQMHPDDWGVTKVALFFFAIFGGGDRPSPSPLTQFNHVAIGVLGEQG